MPGMSWNAEADAKLLLAILECHAFSLDADAVAKKLGHGLTANAIRKRIQRLREMNKASGGSNGSSPAAPKSAAKATPAKRGRRAAAGKEITDDAVDDDEEEEWTTPSKKSKITPVRGKKMKSEPVEDEEDDDMDIKPENVDTEEMMGYFPSADDDMERELAEYV